MKRSLAWLERNRTTLLILTVVGIFLILLFMLIFSLYRPFNIWSESKEDANVFSHFGEFVGGVFGTMATLLTAGLLIFTLWDQKKQFRYNAFATNFYALLGIHRKILESISDSIEGFPGSKEEAGADFFAGLADRICIDFYGADVRRSIANKKGKLKTHTISPECKDLPPGRTLERLLKIYAYYFHVYQSDLGHYFRNIYHIIRFVIDADVDQETKERHIKIFRAQLSNYEILMLAYNCMYRYGRSWKDKVETYELLKNLNFELHLHHNYERRIVDSGILISEYPHLKQSYEEQL